MKFTKVINFVSTLSLRALYSKRPKLITFENLREVRNYQPPKFGGCEEQTADGQFTRPFRSGLLSSLIDKRPVTKGSGYARLYPCITITVYGFQLTWLVTHKAAQYKLQVQAVKTNKKASLNPETYLCYYTCATGMPLVHTLMPRPF